MNDNENTLTGPELLRHFEDNWETEMGAFFPDEGRVVLRGRDLLSEFRDHRWLELLVFAITGQESKTLSRLLDAIWVMCSSYPDPRLWNNRVAALGGTTRTTLPLAIGAASAVSEADTYGLRTGKRAFDVLLRFKEKLDAGEKLEDLIKRELKQYRVVSGYGRPIARNDERIDPLMRFAKSIGCGNGPYVKLAFDISNYFKNSRYPFRININAIIAALLADQGLSLDYIYYFGTQPYIGGMFPVYIDALNKPEGALFPLPTDRINYVGDNFHRDWPVTEA